jgi:hypothetical protein
MEWLIVYQDISGSHIDEYEDGCLLGCHVVWQMLTEVSETL